MTDGPEHALRAYVTAFATLDADTILPFYHLPCMFLTPFGTFLVSDVEASRVLVGMLIDQARSQGYHHTTIRHLDVRQLTPRLAILTGMFVRFNAAQDEIARFGFAYTLLHDGTGWRITVAIAHEADAAAV